MTTASPAQVLDRLKSGYALPVLSPVALRLVELASDDTSSVKDIVGLIEKDPPLAVRLLKVANSALFHGIEPSKTLTQAVMRIGLNRLRIMALSISLRDTFPFGRVGCLDYRRFWRLSLYRALAARAFAIRLGKVHPEEAFIAGLTLEIGLLILYDLFIKGKDQGLRELRLEPLEDLLAWERDRFGMDHRQVGEAALGYWRFPAEILGCQRYPGPPPSVDAEGSLPALCFLTRAFSGMLHEEEGEFPSLHQKARELFGLEEATVNDVVMETLSRVEEIGEALNVEVRRDKDLMAIMEKANKALGRISESVASCMENPAPPLPSFQALDSGRGEVSRTLDAVAHEIRNPLLAVVGFARRLAGAADSGSAGGQYVQIILSEAKRLEEALGHIASSTNAARP
jgi:HD-like signal output (HDOD) protein